MRYLNLRRWVLVPALVLALSPVGQVLAQSGPPPGYEGMQPPPGYDMEAIMAQIEQMQARAAELRSDTQRLAGEFSRLAGEVQANPGDAAGNEQRYNAVVGVEAQISSNISELSSLLSTARQAPPEYRIDESMFAGEIARLQELLDGIAAFKDAYAQQPQLQARAEALQADTQRLAADFARLADAVEANPDDDAGNEQRQAEILSIEAQVRSNRAELQDLAQSGGQYGLGPDAGVLAGALSQIDDLLAGIAEFKDQAGAARPDAAALDQLRTRGHDVRSAALNDPMRPGLQGDLQNLISEADDAIAELRPLLADERGAAEAERGIAELRAMQTELRGHLESIQAFAAIEAAMDELEAEARTLQALVEGYLPSDECQSWLSAADPWEQVQQVQQAIDVQRRYLEERMALMDSHGPGYAQAAAGLRRFVEVEQFFVTVAEQRGVPGRPEMDVFLRIREEGGRLLATSNALYKLVAPEAAPYVDVARLKQRAEEIDHRYRSQAWAYFCSGDLDTAAAQADLAELTRMRRQVDDVAQRYTEVLARPEDPGLLAALALAWQTQGDIEAGLAGAQRALQMGPERGDTNFAYGMLLVAGGAAVEAQTPLTKALAVTEADIKAAPADPALYSQVGKIFQALGAPDEIRVWVEGVQTSFDVQPQIVAGRTMVPFRAISEALGGDVLWNAALREIVVSAPGKEVRMPLGQNHAYVNGQQVALDVPATVVDGRTLVPLRFLSEVMGADVAWLPEWKIIAVTQAR